MIGGGGLIEGTRDCIAFLFREISCKQNHNPNQHQNSNQPNPVELNLPNSKKISPASSAKLICLLCFQYEIITSIFFRQPLLFVFLQPCFEMTYMLQISVLAGFLVLS